MHKHLKKVSVLLLGIVFFALFIRIYDLGKTPAGFLEDEAHIGYNAYSLQKTAKDKNNNFLSLSVDQFGDFRPSGLHFLTVPSVAYFGLTEFATRFPVAVVGGVSVIIMYFLAFEIFQNRKIALLSSAIMAVNPWHLTASRITSESIVALALVMGGIALILRFLRKNEKKVTFLPLLYLGISAVLFVISFQFYHAARYFLPFLLVYVAGVTVFSRTILRWNKIALVVMSFGVMLGLIVLFMVGEGQGRVGNVSIFTNPATKIFMYDQRVEDKGFPPLVVRFFHNNVVAYGYTALVNYGEHFSTNFLFFEGGLPKRYMIPWQGTFHYHDALFLLAGLSLLITFFIKESKRSMLLALPIVWFFLGPIPAAFTFEDIPHFQRAIMMLPGGVMLCAYGLYMIINAFTKRRLRYVFISVLVFVLFYSIVTFFHNYFYHSATHQSRYRNEGERELIKTLQLYKNEGRPIITTSSQGNHVIFFLFYNKFDPKTFQDMGSPRDKNNILLDGYLFKTEDCPSYTASTEVDKGQFNTLYVDLGTCLVVSEVKTLKEIFRPDGTVAFRILEIDVPKIKQYE